MAKVAHVYIVTGRLSMGSSGYLEPEPHGLICRDVFHLLLPASGASAIGVRMAYFERSSKRWHRILNYKEESTYQNVS